MHIFYTAKGGPRSQTKGRIEVRIWRPAGFAMRPPGFRLVPFAVWWVFHQAHLFANRDYAIAMAFEDGKNVHRTCIFPGYFRFPFMGRTDLQLGDLWTDPSCRGRGLAWQTVAYILSEPCFAGRTFWYLVDEQNRSSISVAERNGFTRIGLGEKLPRFGLSALGAYRITKFTK